MLYAMGTTQLKDIGAYIKQHILPQDMTVTEAAKRLGVGRPALSNLLNRKASLSAEMALRLEKAFGADRQDLLDRQAKSDRERQRDADRAVAVPRFVPPFLPIKARQIEAWADTIEARHRLPILLRTLINSTGEGLSRVDFPGHDDAQRSGWDGRVEAAAATPWIPQGMSGWEFGVNQDARSKADKDYAKRLSIPAKERARCTFVFVTPRAWLAKDAWAQTKSAAGDWSDVRAYDRSDLEQWLEQSVEGQVWLAAQLEIPTQGCETLDRFWDRWRRASEPPMTDKIFAPSIAAYLGRFNEWLASPSNRPLYVAADSKEEAVAFVACLFRQPGVSTREGDRAVLFDSPDTLRSLAPSTAQFIPIVRSAETERELAPLVHRRRRCIVVRSSTTTEQCKPDMTVETLGHEAFRRALVGMGIGHDDDRLARESGRSPSILRRRLSNIDAIRSPQWAGDREIAKGLIPMALVGAWHAESSADRRVLSDLSGCAYKTVEENVTRLRQLDDPPVWSVGEHRGVASRIDALFGISGHLIKNDIERFLKSAETVLSEPDPELELPEDQRWAAPRHGKVRTHSPELRNGVCETLVLLAIHGNLLLQDRLGIDMAERVASSIGKLLAPLTLDRLLSHHHDLPEYAEAAPDRFLSLLEHDLRCPEPVLQGLLKPAKGVYWLGAPRPRRIGLLRALECLAWSPDHFPRVSRILAQLAGTKIDDNYGNTPITSLATIYRSWMPQTSAPLEARIQGVEMLASKFPDVGWSICIQQIESAPSGDFSYRPRWRDYASGGGEGVSNSEADEFTRSVIDLVLAWPHHDQKTLGDLVERHRLLRSDDDRNRVWRLVDDYARTETDDSAKAALRERIIRYLSASGARWRSLRHNLTDADRTAARDACGMLGSRDPVFRHGWMFAKPWVEGLDDASGNDPDDGDDWSKRAERVRRSRTDAIAEVWTDQGWNGITRLLVDGDAAHEMGTCAAFCTKGREVEILRACLSSDDVPLEKMDGCMQGYIAAVDEPERADVLLAAAGSVAVDQGARLFRCAPLGAATWRLFDQQPSPVGVRYWKDIAIALPVPSLLLTDAELGELIHRLLLARRPRAAFHAVLWVDAGGKRVETALLRRLLMDVATVDDEPAADRYRIDPHDLSDALDALGERAGVTSGEMAQLELLFIDALGEEGHGIPNLERAVADSPRLFAQAVALVYRRSDDRPDPPDVRFDDPEQLAAAARNAYALLKRLWRIPGTAADGTVETEVLDRWCTELRRLCSEDGRATVGDLHIGQLLSHAPADDEGRWPCGPVCEVMERIASWHIERGFQAEVYNSRGAHWRGMDEGSEQERDLAMTYRRFAQRLAFDYPWVSEVLRRIADIYEREGTSEDSEAELRQRLVH